MQTQIEISSQASRAVIQKMLRVKNSHVGTYVTITAFSFCSGSRKCADGSGRVETLSVQSQCRDALMRHHAAAGPATDREVIKQLANGSGWILAYLSLYYCAWAAGYAASELCSIGETRSRASGRSSVGT